MPACNLACIGQVTIWSFCSSMTLASWPLWWQVTQPQVSKAAATGSRDSEVNFLAAILVVADIPTWPSQGCSYCKHKSRHQAFDSCLCTWQLQMSRNGMVRTAACGSKSWGINLAADLCFDFRHFWFARRKRLILAWILQPLAANSEAKDTFVAAVPHAAILLDMQSNSCMWRCSNGVSWMLCLAVGWVTLASNVLLSGCLQLQPAKLVQS